jgi:hypothetical protein
MQVQRLTNRVRERLKEFQPEAWAEHEASGDLDDWVDQTASQVAEISQQMLLQQMKDAPGLETIARIHYARQSMGTADELALEAVIPTPLSEQTSG